MKEPECPLSDVGDNCQAFRITCTGRNLCDLKRRITEYHQAQSQRLQASLCRECKRPDEAVKDHCRKWAESKPDLDMSRRCEENRER